jgi:DNA-binding NarL/FixJ family response regulator
MLSIAIVDSQEITRYAVQALFKEAYDDNIVFIEIKNLQELKRFLSESKNGIVVFDPHAFGFDAYNSAFWLLFFSELNEYWLKYLLYNKPFPHSVALKEDELADIQKAIRAVLQGKKYFTSFIKEKLDDHNHSIYKVEQVLTQAEREILREIASGKITREIAAERSVSVHTIITHRKNIFKKLEVNSIHEATRYAIRAGIITVNDYYI